MITTNLTWYSVEEKLPSETDNIMFITKKENSNSHLFLGYYSELRKVFIEENKELDDVSAWTSENVAYWAVIDYYTLYNKLLIV